MSRFCEALAEDSKRLYDNGIISRKHEVLSDLMNSVSPAVKKRFWFLSRIVALAMLLHVLVVGPLYGCYARSEFGSDELCMASYYGDTDKIALLLNAGADLNRTGWDEHYTPLGEAVRAGQIESAKLLLARGADPNAPNDRGFGKTAATTIRDYFEGYPDNHDRVIELIRASGGR